MLKFESAHLFTFYIDLRGHMETLPIELAQNKTEEEGEEIQSRYLKNHKRRNRCNYRRARNCRDDINCRWRGGQCERLNNKRKKNKRKKNKRKKRKKKRNELFDEPVRTVKNNSWIEQQRAYETTELKSNAAPCAGTSNSICADFNIGTDKNGNGENGGTNSNANGDTINGNGYEKVTKTLKLDTDDDDETEEPTDPETPEPIPTFVSFHK